MNTSTVVTNLTKDIYSFKHAYILAIIQKRYESEITTTLCPLSHNGNNINNVNLIQQWSY